MAQQRNSKMKALKSLSNNDVENTTRKRQKTYCVCQGPSEGLMIECETCHEWYHCDCVNVDEDKIPEHYFCDFCANDKTPAEENLEEAIVEALSLLSGCVMDSPTNRRERSESPKFNSDMDISSDRETLPGSLSKYDELTVPPRKRSNSGLQAAISEAVGPMSPMGAELSSDDSSPSELPSSPPTPPSPGRRMSHHSLAKTYTRKSKKQIAVLEKYYLENPSPDTNMIHAIANECNLPEQKVSRWFYDKRRRSKQLQSTSQ